MTRSIEELAVALRRTRLTRKRCAEVKCEAYRAWLLNGSFLSTSTCLDRSRSMWPWDNTPHPIQWGGDPRRVCSKACADAIVESAEANREARRVTRLLNRAIDAKIAAEVSP